MAARRTYYGYGTKEVDRGYGDDYSHHKVGRDGYRIRKKEEIDDWCYSSQSGGRSYTYSNGKYDNKTEEREPGELSSGSDGSDGSVASALVDGGDVEVGLPPRKKRKFQSPKVASSPGSSSLLHQEWHRSCHREVEQVEDDGFIPQVNILGSRWADADEGECKEDVHGKGKHMSTSGSSLTSLSSKMWSPEVGEFTSGNGREFNSQIEDVEVEGDDGHNKRMWYGIDSDSDEENDTQQRNILNSSRSVHEFERLNKIGAGTYGVVYQCKDKMNGQIVALKKVKMDKETEGFPMSSLREINILTSLRHPSIVEVKEVVVEEDVKHGSNGTYLVMEYMEHDLKGLMEAMKQSFSQSEVKCLMLQLLEGVKYLHDNWVLHRDLKTSNILLNNRGELKICDFGLSRQYGSPLKPYTPLVVTLWYRAPELLLGAKQYSTAIDMWSLGCIMAELLAKKPLFNGESEIDQLNKIFKTLGTPTEINWPGFSKLPGVKVNFVKQKYNLLREKFPPRSFIGSPYLSAAGFDLLDKLLTCDPEKRITVADAVNHDWFREVPLPKAKEFMPTFPAQHDKSRHRDDLCGERFSLGIYFSCRMASLLASNLKFAPFVCFLRLLKAKRGFTSMVHTDSVNGMIY